MRRFWIDSSCLKGREFTLTGQVFHHILRVSRIQKGEPFELLSDGRIRYTVALNAVSHSKATARILKSHPAPPLPRPYFHLALSLPRLNIVDSILQKAVELGVKDFHPFISEMSFLKKPPPLSRLERWKKIISRASAVSGRTRLITLHPALNLREMEIPKNHGAFMAYEGARGKSFREILKPEKPFEEIWLFIGSEGGFSRKEAEAFSRKGGEVFSFGDQILRVETACLMGLSILKYHYHQKRL